MPISRPMILYDNLFDYGAPVATDTASGYDALNIRDWRTYTLHKFASAGTKYITVDCGAAKAAAALSIHTHNLGTAAATVSVESSGTGAWAGEEVVRLAGFVPPNDRIIIKAFTEASARYWRIKIVTASLAAQLAIGVLAPRLDFPEYLSVPFTPYAERPIVESTRSRTGQLLGSVVQYYDRMHRVRFEDIAWSFVMGDYKTFWEQHGSLLKPFIWAWDVTDHADLAHLAIMDKKTEFAMPLTISTYVDALEFHLRSIRE